MPLFRNIRSVESSPVRLFVRRGVILFLGWELLYLCLLKPSGVPDRWLTTLTSRMTATIISWIYRSAHVIEGRPMCMISMDGEEVLGIADGCNGLQLFLLYTGFLICYPLVGIRRKMIYGISGTVILFSINILRCTAIAGLTLWRPGLVHFAHHYAFTVIVYSLIFGGWILFSKKDILHDH